jgi:hypothetical protein
MIMMTRETFLQLSLKMSTTTTDSSRQVTFADTNLQATPVVPPDHISVAVWLLVVFTATLTALAIAAVATWGAKRTSTLSEMSGMRTGMETPSFASSSPSVSLSSSPSSSLLDRRVRFSSRR